MNWSTRRAQLEERANSLTHGVGLVASLAGTAVIVVSTALHGDPRRVVAAAIYGFSLVALYGASTAYHGCRRPRLKRSLEKVDHFAIYLLIAGTYTPIALVTLGGWMGWTLFGLVWGVAAGGIVMKALFFGRFRVLSTLFYVGMGWLGVIAVRPLLAHLSTGGLVWLLAGGLAYTVGTVFYHNRRLRYAHAVWHVFVLAGSLCHFLAIALYVLPRVS